MAKGCQHIFDGSSRPGYPLTFDKLNTDLSLNISSISQPVLDYRAFTPVQSTIMNGSRSPKHGSTDRYMTRDAQVRPNANHLNRQGIYMEGYVNILITKDILII